MHCDLKAANILTTKGGNVKLTDFGVSLNLKMKNVEDGVVAGTPNWSKFCASECLIIGEQLLT